MKPYYILDPRDIKKVGDEYFHNRGWQPITSIGGKVLNDLIRRPINMDEMIHNRQGKIETKATGRKITIYGSTMASKKYKKTIQQPLQRSNKPVQRRKARSSRQAS
jgi:hypothetical protein